jgi:two-component system sensor histidine kinase/response regulator
MWAITYFMNLLDLLSNYFITNMDGVTAVTSSYNYGLVALSIAVAMFTSTMSLHLVNISVLGRNPVYQQVAIFTSALALGLGIWSMHFIGMLAFQLHTRIYYDPALTALSAVPGVIASWVALFLSARQSLSTRSLIAGGIIVGSGIGIMHYLGMFAMQMGLMMQYDPAWFAASVVVAVILAIVALLTQFRLRLASLSNMARNCLAGMIMGIAISGMHYVGMNSAVFLVDGQEYVIDNATKGSQVFLGVAVALVTLAVMMLVAATNWLMRYREILNEVGENERRLKAILETAVDGIITISDRGIVQGYNPAAERILGWQADEVVGNNIKMLMPEHERSEHDGYLAHYQKTREPSIIGSGREVMALHKSGALVPIRLGVGEVKLNQTTTLYVGFLTDISHRHEMEKALREREAQLSSLMNNIPGAAFRCRYDEQWSVLYVNDAIEALTGWTPCAFIKGEIRMLDLLFDEDKMTVLKHLKDMHLKKNYTIEYRIRHKQGHTVWIMDRGTFHQPEEGHDGWIDGLLYDISDRRQMEESLKEEKAKAEEAAEAKAAFMANMSHEIRTPMNAIIGFSDILGETQLQDDQRKYLNTIHSSAKSLLHLLNDILDSAKMEKGKLDLEEMDFSLTELVDSVISTLWLQARSKSLELNLTIEPEVLEHYFGAPDRIRQVLMNLLGNAVKFTEQGSVSLHVYGSEQDVCFDVIDTGIGISKERLAAIFDPFTQADASMSRRYGGTGLGTTISKQLVELMGGHIYAHSELNTGSTFGFSLPLKPGKAVHKRDIRCIETLPELSVLAADDIEQNIQLLTLILERQGHRVTAVSNGLEAVEAYQNDTFDIVLMDIQMPKLDGHSAAKAIRQYEQEHGRPATPIIALTASAQNEDKTAADEAGMSGFATKPVDFDQLNAEMARVLGLKDQKGPSLEEPTSAPIKPHAIRDDKGLSLWGDLALYTQELHRFDQDLTQHIAEIERLFDQNDLPTLSTRAHALRGVSSNLALATLASLLGDIENAAKSYHSEKLASLLEQVPSAVDAFREDLINRFQQPQAVETTDKPSNHEDTEQYHRLLSTLIKHADHCEVDDDVLEAFLNSAPNQAKAAANAINHAFSDFEFEDAKEQLLALQSTTSS